jgi:non-specific serine/threonine protein kinase
MAGVRAAAMLHGALGHSTRATTFAEELKDLAQQAGNCAELSRAETLLGVEALRSGEPAAARPRFEAALESARRAEHSMLIGHAMVNLGSVLEADAQADVLRGALAYFEEAGDAWGTAYAAGYLAKALGDERAVELAARAVRLLADLGDRFYLIFAVEDLARIVLRKKRIAAAARLFGWAGVLRRETGALLSPGSRDEHERTIGEMRASLGETGFEKASATGASMTIGDLLDEAMTVSKPDHALTRREQDVARLLARGMTNREIAVALTITPGTAGIHVEHILRKLGLRSRHQVAQWVTDNGLV